MTSPDKIARRKLSLLELASELSNVSGACKVMGYSRQQTRLLERFSPEFRERHIEAPHTGSLVAVDTFFVGTLKGVGKLYLQTAIDCHSRYAWARLYSSKLPVTAVHLMNNDVILTFEQHKAKIEIVLSDNGRKFCGRPDQHPYELYLRLEEVEHRTTRVKRPQTNGIVERLHRTLLDEHFRVEGRRTWFETVEEMQMECTPKMRHKNKGQFLRRERCPQGSPQGSVVCTAESSRCLR
jgi:transposase InsO family protein